VIIIELKIFESKENIVIFLLFSAAFFYLFWKIRFGINLYDEGISLYGAVRVLEGYIPYKDFYYLYPPGNLYVLALLFKSFGPSILISRIFNFIISFLILICSYIIIKNIVSDKISLYISFILITLWLGIDQSFSSVSIPILSILIASIFVFKYLNNRMRSNLVIIGILTGITAYFRLDFSLYLFLSVTLILTMFNYEYYLHLGDNKLLSLIRSEKSLLIFVVTSILTVIPLIIFLLYYIPIYQLISQFITYPMQIYPLYHNLPLTYHNLNLLPTILFIYACASGYMIYKQFKGTFNPTKDFKVVFMLILGLCLLYYAKVRPDIGHFFPTIIIAIILFAYVCSEIIVIMDLIQPKIAIKNIKSSLLKFFIICIVIGSFLIFIIPVSSGNMTPLDLERGHGIYIHQPDDLVAAVKYIQLKVPSNEKIFIGDTTTDRTVGSNVMFYFLSGRDSGVFYYDLEPGVITTHQVQLEMIKELKQNKVSYIILWSGADNIIEPNKSNQSSGVEDLDNFISNHYIKTEKFGNYTIYLKKN